MKISCCIFDLDGTLLTSEHRISDIDKKTLQDLKKKGIKIVIATGRSIHQAKEYIRELEISDPVITFNGALIANPATGEVITKKVFPIEEVHAIEALMKEEGLNYFFYTTSRVYYVNDCDYYRFQEHYNSILPEELRIPIFHISEMTEEEYSDVLVIALNNDTAIIPSLKAKLDKIAKVSLLDSGRNIMDLIPAGTSKGEAIKELLSHFHIPISETVAFGDSQNDETMFDAVGFSVAMGNAYETLQKKADFVSKTNDDYGITYALNTLLSESESV